MRKWTNLKAGEWLLRELASARVQLGQGLSVRKLTNAALQAGYPGDVFLTELGILLDDRLLAVDGPRFPARTVCVTLTGHQRIAAIREALADGRPPPRRPDTAHEKTRYQTTIQFRAHDRHPTRPSPLAAR